MATLEQAVSRLKELRDEHLKVHRHHLAVLRKDGPAALRVCDHVIETAAYASVLTLVVDAAVDNLKRKDIDYKAELWRYAVREVANRVGVYKTTSMSGKLYREAEASAWQLVIEVLDGVR